MTRNRAVSALIAWLACLPAVVSWVVKVIVHPRPFWVQFYDPETIYFYEGLRLTRGQVPLNVDNPGTPLQVLSAAIAIVTGRTPAAYERFLLVGHTVGLLVTVAAILVLLRTVFRGVAPLLAVTGIWALFIAPQMLERIDIWGPEILFLPFGALALAAGWRWSEERTDRALFLFGMAAGLCVAVKFVFASWAIALVAVSWRRPHVAVGGLAAGFILGTFPVAPRYLDLLPRLIALSHNRGEQRWGDLLPMQKAWMVWVLVVLLLAAWRARDRRVLAVFAGLAIVLSYVQAFGAPSFRYLLPTALCVALLFALAVQRPLPAGARIGIAALGAILLLKAFASDLRAHRARIQDGAATRAAIMRAIRPGEVVLFGWRTPIPSFALRVTAADPRDLHVISEMYPLEGHFDPWRKEVVLPDGAAQWDALVLLESDRQDFPELRARLRTRVGGFLILERP